MAIKLPIGKGQLIGKAKDLLSGVGETAGGLIKSTFGSIGSAGAEILNSKGGIAAAASAASVFGGKNLDKDSLGKITGAEVGQAARAAAKGGASDGINGPLPKWLAIITPWKVNQDTSLYELNENGEKQISFVTCACYLIPVAVYLLMKKGKAAKQRVGRAYRSMRSRFKSK